MTEAMRFNGQVIAISGAGRGLGRAMAIDAASRGATVVINDYGTSIAGDAGGDPTPAEATLVEIESLGGKGCISIADVGTQQGAEEVINTALKNYGRIDGLVHAACVFPPQCAFEDFSRQNYERVMRVTADGAWGLAQAAWPHFKAQNFGRIVLIQSAAGFYGRVGMPGYGIAKSSMIGFTSYLAQEGAPHGILVNNVSPVGWSRAPASEGDQLAYMEQMTPASSLGPVVSMLLHPKFDRTNLLLHSANSD